MGKNPREVEDSIFLSCHGMATELQASPHCTPPPSSLSVFETGERNFDQKFADLIQ